MVIMGQNETNYVSAVASMQALFTSPLGGVRSIVMSPCIHLSIHPSVHPWPNFTKFLCTLPVAMGPHLMTLRYVIYFWFYG